MEEEEEQKRGREGAGARAQKKVRRRTTENVGKVCKKMKSSVPVERPGYRYLGVTLHPSKVPYTLDIQIARYLDDKKKMTSRRTRRFQE